MNRISALKSSIGLLAVACLSSCAMYPASEDISACTDSSPKKNVKIEYGDSHLSVDVKEQKIKRDEYLAFDLKPNSSKGPNNLDYKTVMVTIKGKDEASDWISASGSADGSDGPLLVCVPTGQAPGTYYYLIEVEKVGTLDPRVAVQPS